MNAVQRIAKNAGVLLGANLFHRILLFFYVMYTVRHLGTEGFGILSFAFAFSEIFSIFADFGLVPLIIREVARDNSLASKYLANVTAMKLIMVAFTFGLVALFVNLLGYPAGTVNVVYLVALAVIFTAFNKMYDSVFQAFERMEYVSLGQIFKGILLLAGAIIAIRFDFGVLVFALFYSVASFVVLGYSVIILRLKFIGQRFESATGILEIDRSFWKKSIKEAWPLGVMATFVMIYFRIDTVMISLMKTDTDVGLYGAAYRLSEASTIIPAMFMASVFPIMAKTHEDSKRWFVSICGRAFKYMLYLAVPMALTVTLLARPIIILVFKEEFLGSVIALQILIWAAAIMYLGMVLGTVFVTANKQRLSMKITIVVVILNIILNLILIPRYSYVGASLTTVATKILGLIAGIFYLNKYGYKIVNIGDLLPPGVGILVAGVLIVVLNLMEVSIFIIAAVTVGLYCAIVYGMGIKEDDRQLMKSVFSLR
jgi:O-antigen/teichoic acid export membrane protein